MAKKKTTIKEKKIKITTAAVIHEPGSSVNSKTGGWRSFRPVRDAKKCTNCGFCWMFCPDNAINEKFIANLDYCKGCGICAKVCPFKAIEMVKEEK